MAAGKARHVGVSNETPWGVMTLIRLAETAGLPRIVSNQNPYSLLNRSFEVGGAEIAMREGVGAAGLRADGRRRAFGQVSGRREAAPARA